MPFCFGLLFLWRFVSCVCLVLFCFAFVCARMVEALKSGPLGRRTAPESVACRALERDLPLGPSADLPCRCGGVLVSLRVLENFLLDTYESGWRALNFAPSPCCYYIHIYVYMYMYICIYAYMYICI